MLPESLEPSYFTAVPGLPTIPSSSSHRPSANPVTVRREIALGSYELARRCAEVSDYNNPLDALQTQLAIAAQEKTLQEDEERQRRRARRDERKIAKSLRKLRLEEHGSSRRSKSRSRSSRKATPYVSERSASSSSESDDQRSRKHRHHVSSQTSKYNQKARRVPSPAEPRRHVSEIFHGGSDDEKYVSEHIEEQKVPQQHSSRTSISHDIPQIELTVPSSDNRHSSTQDHAVSTAQSLQDVVKSTDSSLRQSTSGKSPEASVRRARTSASHSDQTNTKPSKASEANADRAVLHIVFADGQTFDLTHKELLVGGLRNSFLRSWASSSHRPSEGEILTVKMPHDRDANLFTVIHEFLKGLDIIPLSPDGVAHLSDESMTSDAFYKRLYKEAKLYGIRELAENIEAYQKREKEEALDSDEPFRVYDCVSNVALGKHDLQTIAQYIHASTTEPSGPLRAVVLGAAINFMSRKGKSRETILDFSLVAPLTSISRAFSKIVECSVDFQAGQIIFEGSLTKEECRNVILDIMCFDDTASEQIKTQDSTPVIRRYPFTLEAILLALEPRQSRQSHGDLGHIFESFNLEYFSQEGSAIGGSSGRNLSSPSSSSHNSISKFYLNLPYATVCLRFSIPDPKFGRARAIFEQIHTASRDVLREHSLSQKSHRSK